MTRLEHASLLDPANQRPLSRGVGAAAHIGGLVIGRAILEPGWRWSEDVKPIVGTEWCEVHHLQLIVSGRLAVGLADADEVDEFVAGDLIDIVPGHDAWVVGDEPCDLIDLSGNSAQFGVPASLARQVVTMLMSDIVDSTPTAARLGDARWRQTLGDHNRIIRREIERFRGRELDTTGDGFFVAFDSAASGVAAAIAAQGALADHAASAGFAPSVRIGLHTADATRRGNDYSGVGVHVQRHTLALADADEIVVSRATLDEAGGVEHTNPRSATLKGVAAPVEVASLSWS